MTTVIMLEGTDGAIHAAADRRITTDSGRYYTLDTPKLHTWGDIIVGFAGTLALIAPAVELITALTERTPATIAKALRTLVQEDGNDGEWLDLLVGWKGHGVYQVSGDGSCFRTTRGYDAIGSGAAFALGYMYAYQRQNVDSYWPDGCEGAIHCAASFDTGTDHDVDVVEI